MDPNYLLFLSGSPFLPFNCRRNRSSFRATYAGEQPKSDDDVEIDGDFCPRLTVLSDSERTDVARSTPTHVLAGRHFIQALYAQAEALPCSRSGLPEERGCFIAPSLISPAPMLR